MRGTDLRPAPRLTGRGGIRGLAYVSRRKDLRLIMLLIFVLGTFGMNFQITHSPDGHPDLPQGAGEYGLLGSIMAIGSWRGAADRRAQGARLWIMLVAPGVRRGQRRCGARADLPDLCGAARAGRLHCAHRHDGRQHARADARRPDHAWPGHGPHGDLHGGTPIGAPIIGWIGEHAGPRWTILVGSIGVGLVLAVVSRLLLKEENVRVSWDTERRPH